MTCGPSTSGDSLISHCNCGPPKSFRMLRCQTADAVGLEAREVAVLGEHVEAIAVDGRRAARSSAPIGPHLVSIGSERLRPHFLAVGAIERDDEAVAAARALEVDTRSPATAIDP